MLRVLTKTACYIEGAWHAANTEIHILAEHFAQETHVLLDDLDLVKAAPAPEPAPVEPKPADPAPAEETHE